MASVAGDVHEGAGTDHLILVAKDPVHLALQDNRELLFVCKTFSRHRSHLSLELINGPVLGGQIQLY